MTKNNTKARKCEAVTKSGKPCKCNAQDGSLFCATHSKDDEAMSSLPVHDQRIAAAKALHAAMNGQEKADEAINAYALRLSTRFQWIGHKLEELGEGSHWTDAKGLEYRIKQAGGAGSNAKPLIDLIAKAYKAERDAAKELWASTRKSDSNKNRLFYLVRKASIDMIETPEAAPPTVAEQRERIDNEVKAAIARTSRALFKLTSNECCSDDALALYALQVKVAKAAGIDLAAIEETA